jgi:capsule biosynthesis phosphatase
MVSMRVVFDLDDTLCWPNDRGTNSHDKYSMAEPREEVIKIVRQMKEEGWYIIISTARRMLTHEGNVEAVIKDVGALTADWLAKHEVPYDELQFGKPYSNTWYIDDKALRPEELLKTWKNKEEA